MKAGEQYRACTYTNNRLADITVWKYRDMNADGDREGGPPTRCWTAGRCGCWDGMGNLETLANQPPQMTVGGKVVFENLAPGTYRVCETPQPNWYNSDPGPAGPVFNCKDIGSPSATRSELWFGNYRTTLTVIKEVVSLPNDPQDFVFSGSLRTSPWTATPPARRRTARSGW